MLSIYSNIYLSRSYRLFVQFWAFDFSHDKINGIFSKWFELMSYTSIPRVGITLLVDKSRRRSEVTARSFPKRPYSRVRDLLAIFTLDFFSYC